MFPLHWIAEILHAQSCQTGVINFILNLPEKHTVYLQYMRYSGQTEEQQTDVSH